MEELLQFVTFQVGREEYGVDINAITEVVRPLRITELPKMPPFIEGVVNLRGVIIPVVDLRSRFEVSRAAHDPRKMRMIITRGAVQGTGGSQGLLGLVVDSVDEVVHIRKKEIDAAPQAATGKNAPFITGMGKLGDRLIILLSISELLSYRERTVLAEAGREEVEGRTEHGEPAGENRLAGEEAFER